VKKKPDNKLVEEVLKLASVTRSLTRDIKDFDACRRESHAKASTPPPPDTAAVDKAYVDWLFENNVIIFAFQRDDKKAKELEAACRKARGL
jgi:hypothetical protein